MQIQNTTVIEALDQLNTIAQKDFNSLPEIIVIVMMRDSLEQHYGAEGTLVDDLYLDENSIDIIITNVHLDVDSLTPEDLETKNFRQLIDSWVLVCGKTFAALKNICPKMLNRDLALATSKRIQFVCAG